MHITTWNVNSIRAREALVLDWLTTHQPDVLCLQEIKVEEAQFPRAGFEAAGYHLHLNAQRTYNGVALISKQPLENVTIGLGVEALDAHKRLIAGTLNGVRIINIYAPNGQSPEAPAFAFKEQWFKALRAYLNTHHTPDEPLLICGDFNIAPADLDVWDPTALTDSVCFHPHEHAWLSDVKDWGLVDVYRQHDPQTPGFTWWDYRAASFQRNHGMRIDYFLMTAPLAAKCVGIVPDKAPRKLEKPSDHIPVTATLQL